MSEFVRPTLETLNISAYRLLMCAPNFVDPQQGHLENAMFHSNMFM